MTHKVALDVDVEDPHAAIDEAIGKYPYSAARFVDGITVELWFVETQQELEPILERMRQRPGHTTSWAKGN